MDSSEETAVAMSKSEINRITKGLREAVKQHFSESGDAETLTVNSIRTKAEVNLSLEKDFLRTNSFWRNESKKIIREEFVSFLFFLDLSGLKLMGSRKDKMMQ